MKTPIPALSLAAGNNPPHNDRFCSPFSKFCTQKRASKGGLEGRPALEQNSTRVHIRHLLRTNANPANPELMRIIVAGSGTGAVAASMLVPV